MKADIAARFDSRVPRYTSYPTAPHFGGDVDGGVYRRWLGELDPAAPLSLYFHVPFCESLCWFCGCHTKIVKRHGPVAGYLQTLHEEIDLVADALPGRFRAAHLHWGGGSPTMLSPEDWRRAMDHLRGRFDIADGAEIAVELDPRGTTEDYVRALAGAGVNRASIGVQDFHPDVQAAVNRIQPFAVTERVMGWLAKHGIGAINMDLMIGLPQQTTTRMAETVDRAAGLAPDRVAVFAYAHVPWMKKHQKMIEEEALPGAALRWDLLQTAADGLAGHGYVPIGLDHFARPGDTLARALDERRLRRNFQGYTTDRASTLLGFGASAISSLPQGFAQNLVPLKTYRETVAGGRFPIARGLVLSPDDALRGAVIESLMCYLEADIGGICARHGTDPGTLDAEIAALIPLETDGICMVAGRRVRVTESCRPLVRLVAAAFDSYLESGERRHARAV